MARPRIDTRTSARRRLAAAAAAVGVATIAAGLACTPKRSVESFCAQLKTVQDLDDVLASGDRARVGDLAGELGQLRQVSPDDIEPQVDQLAAVTDDLARTMGTTPDPEAAVADVFSRHRAELPEITAAGRAVEAYAAQHCQVVLNPTTSTPPAERPPATAPPAQGPKTTRRPAPRASSQAPTSRSSSATTRRSPTSRSATTTTRRR